MTREYYAQGADGAADANNWFNSGDVATIDENGYVLLVDRSKDLIKSGGSGSAPSCWRTLPPAILT